MRKFGLLLAAVGLSLLLCGSATATSYAINFDADGTLGIFSPTTIYGWDAEAIPGENIPEANGGTGDEIDMVTHQSLGTDDTLGNGDTFTEDITFRLLNDLGEPNSYTPINSYGAYLNRVWFSLSQDLTLDVTLDGYIDSYNSGAQGATTLGTLENLYDDSYTAHFTDATGNLYADGTSIASFSFVSGTDFELNNSVFSQGGSTDVEISFQFDTIDTDYFQTAPGMTNIGDMVANNWLLAFSQNSIALLDGEVGGDPLADPDEILLGFQETGMDVKFQAVPEPATMLLLGVGLLGIAGFSRKKILKS